MMFAEENRLIHSVDEETRQLFYQYRTMEKKSASLIDFSSVAGLDERIIFLNRYKLFERNGWFAADVSRYF